MKKPKKFKLAKTLKLLRKQLKESEDTKDILIGDAEEAYGRINTYDLEDNAWEVVSGAEDLARLAQRIEEYSDRIQLIVDAIEVINERNQPS